MAEATGGYDYVFISDIPEDLVCSLCHFPFKNPLQIEECGHIFCSDCFEQTKDHAETNSLELCCPLDRQKINVARVFKDKYIERKVLSLDVKCRNFDDDCTWTGELREALDHEIECGRNEIMVNESFGFELKQILKRLEGIEVRLTSKDKQLDNQNQQIASQQKLFYDLQKKNEFLNKKNEDINQKLENYEKQAVETNNHIVYLKKQMEDQNKQFECLKKLVRDDKKQIENLNKQINDQDKEIQSLKKQNKDKNTEAKNKNKVFEDKIKKIEDQSNEVQKQKDEILRLQKSVNVNNMILENGDKDFLTASSAFQWKFKLNKVRSGIPSFSPEFCNIINGMRFQVCVQFQMKEFQIFLVRIKSVYDHATNELTTKMPHDFVVNILGGNEKRKLLTFSLNSECNAHSDDPMARKSWYKVISNNEFGSLTIGIGGDVHMYCFFQ